MPEDGAAPGGRAPSSTPQVALSCAALLWDMDGTLIDSATAVPDAFIATVNRFGGSRLDQAQVVALYSLGEPAVMLERMLGRSVGRTEVDAYHDELKQRARSVTPYPQVKDALERVGSLMPMAVFTGASTQAAEILLDAAGLMRFFDQVVGGDQIRNPKPNPDGIILASGRLGLGPKRCAYIGDAPTDLEAARRSGAAPLAAGWGHLFDPTRTGGATTFSTPMELATALLASHQEPGR